MAGFFESLEPVLKDTLRNTGQAMLMNPNASMGDVLGYAAGNYLGSRLTAKPTNIFQGDAAQQAKNYVNSPESVANRGFMESIGLTNSNAPKYPFDLKMMRGW